MKSYRILENPYNIVQNPKQNPMESLTILDKML